jgi:hypothetical protein
MFETKMAVPLLLGSHFDHVIATGSMLYYGCSCGKVVVLHEAFLWSKLAGAFALLRYLLTLLTTIIHGYQL